jgi:hypothetical protein
VPVDPEARERFLDTDYAWAAGFLDGEGCFTVVKSGHDSNVLSPVINCGQTNVDPLMRLQSMFGGNVRQSKRKYTSNQSIAHYWHLTDAASVLRCIDKLLPYLSCKRGEAELLAQICKLVGKRGVKTTYLNIHRRQCLHRAMLSERAGRKVSACQ